VNKLTGVTRLSRRKSVKDSQESPKPQEKITTVSIRCNSSSPVPLLLTENDRADFMARSPRGWIG